MSNARIIMSMMQKCLSLTYQLDFVSCVLQIYWLFLKHYKFYWAVEIGQNSLITVNSFLLLKLIEPILDDRLREKILKPWKGVLCIHFCVSPSVCPQATKHTFWLGNLIFGLSGPLDMRKKTHFFCFSKFSFLRFL